MYIFHYAHALMDNESYTYDNYVLQTLFRFDDLDLYSQLPSQGQNHPSSAASNQNYVMIL